MPVEVVLPELVSLAKLRWRIDRDYQKLKGELGLDHYEGRRWRRFQHHGVISGQPIASRRPNVAVFFPPQAIAFLQPPALPQDFTPWAPPVRPQRHDPTPITTYRILRARALVARIPYCLTCGSNEDRAHL